MGCHFLLQGIFPTQELNLGLLLCRQTLYPLSHQGSLFIIGDWNAKVGSQETPGVTGKFGLGVKANRPSAKANRVLPKEHTGHSKHPLPTTQEKTQHMSITRWSIPKSDWLYYLQPRWRNSVQSAKTRLGPDCGSDHELLIAKFRLKLKKIGKTTRPSHMITQ